MRDTGMRDEDRLLRRLEAEQRDPGAAAGGDPAASDPLLERRLVAWRAIVDDLGAHGSASFGPTFRGLVLEGIRAGKTRGEAALYGQLRWMFTRVAVAGAAAALVLGAYNASGGHETAGSFVDNVFGLPATDLGAAILLAGDTP